MAYNNEVFQVIKLPPKLLTESCNSILYKIATSKHEIELARRFQHDGYLHVGYIKEPTPTGKIEDDYWQYSDYIMAISLDEQNNHNGSDITGDITGVIRLVKNSKNGFPVLNDFDLFPEIKRSIRSLNLDNTVEIGALFAMPGSNVGRGLYRAAWQYSKARSIKHWLAGIDKRVYRIFEKAFYFSFKQIGPEKHYVGSITVPAILDPAAQVKRLYKINPKLGDFYDKPSIKGQIELI